MFKYETRFGTIHFSNEYLTKLVGHAVSSCYGVVGMVPKGTQKIVNFISNKNRLNEGIFIKGNMDSVSIEIHITVSYGMNINAIAKSIMHKVEYTFETATGIHVDKVVVKVDGIEE